jgi:uncharacterized protein (TIGR00730 family)
MANESNEHVGKLDDLRSNVPVGAPSDEFGWRIFKIMAEFVEGFQMIRELKNTVSIFGSARFRPTNKHYKEARELAQMLGNAGYTIVTGGGPGIMEGGNRGAKDVGAPSIGLNIQLPKEQRINPYVTRGMGFHYFFTRKVMLSYASQAYVYFPGGFGTLDELAELLTLIQTKKIAPIPVILVGKDFWAPFIEWVRTAMYEQHRAIDKEDMDMFYLVHDVREAFRVIQNVKKCPPNATKCWIGFQPEHLDKQTPAPEPKK